MGRRQREGVTSPYTLPHGSSCKVLGVSCAHSLIHWVILTCKEAYPNDKDLPGHVVTWKSVEEILQILRKLGRKQAIYISVFEGPDQATFTTGMKAKELRFTSSIWYMAFTSMLSPGY